MSLMIFFVGILMILFVVLGKIEGNSIKIYLKAATQDGYTFVFTLWEGSFTEDDNARAQEYLDGSYNQTVVDANGNIWNKAE